MKKKILILLLFAFGFSSNVKADVLSDLNENLKNNLDELANDKTIVVKYADLDYSNYNYFYNYEFNKSEYLMIYLNYLQKGRYYLSEEELNSPLIYPTASNNYLKVDVSCNDDNDACELSYSYNKYYKKANLDDHSITCQIIDKEGNCFVQEKISISNVNIKFQKVQPNNEVLNKIQTLKLDSSYYIYGEKFLNKIKTNIDTRFEDFYFASTYMDDNNKLSEILDLNIPNDIDLLYDFRRGSGDLYASFMAGLPTVFSNGVLYGKLNDLKVYQINAISIPSYVSNFEKYIKNKIEQYVSEDYEISVIENPSASNNNFQFDEMGDFDKKIKNSFIHKVFNVTFKRKSDNLESVAPIVIYTVDDNQKLISNGSELLTTNKELTTKTFKVNNIFNQMTSGELDSINSSLKEKEIIDMFDISMYNSDNTKYNVENEYISIKIPLTSNLKKYKNLEVVFIDDTNSIRETVTPKVDDGFIIFETTHLSTYGIIGSLEENSTTLLGDMNNNGKLDLNDVIILLKKVLGM